MSKQNKNVEITKRERQVVKSNSITMVKKDNVLEL